MRLYEKHLLKKFVYRTDIIKRRTVRTERRSFCPTETFFGGDPMGRGGRLDAHRARVYLNFRLACEVAGFTPPKILSLGTPDAPRRSSGGMPPVNAWLSGALFRLRMRELLVKHARKRAHGAWGIVPSSNERVVSQARSCFTLYGNRNTLGQ